jgi:hypothetical protein
MADNASQSGGSASQSGETTELLRQIAALASSVQRLAERSTTDASGPDAESRARIAFAYTALGSLLGRGESFDDRLPEVDVERQRGALVFGDLRGATAARVRARVHGVDELVELDSLSDGQKVALPFDDDQPIDGIELLDAPDGAVVAFGRLDE